MNRAQRRAQKCQPRKYTESELDRLIRDAVSEVAKNNLRITIAACALVLHREFKFGKERLGRVINGINTLSFETLNVGELQHQLYAETGVDLKFYEDVVTTGLEV